MAVKHKIKLLTTYVFISKCSSQISLVQVRWCSVVNMNRFKDLESNSQEAVEDIKALLKDQFNNTRESWLMKGIYEYYLIYNSSRAVDVIASVKEPHDTYFFDRSLEGLKSNNKHPHLALLGHVVRKRPIWLFKISQHAVFHELIRLLKTESDIVTVVSALLIINILLPFIPGVLGKHLPQLFSVFSKLAAMNTTTDKYHEAQLIHLQISLYMLFHRLYGMFPCNFLFYLHKEYSSNEHMLPVFSHTVKPMLDTVRVNPLLITGNSEWEKEAERWKNIEPHDIIITCAKLLMAGNNVCESTTSAYEVRSSSLDCKNMLGALKVTGKHSVVDFCNELSRKSEEMHSWSPSFKHQGISQHIESTPTRIPSTPITRGFEVSSPHSEHEGSSPPEAAVEATPETTPSRDYVDVSRSSLLIRTANHSVEPLSPSSKVPISDRSFPNSPIKKDAPQFPFSVPDMSNTHTIHAPKSKRVDKLLRDRNQVTSEEPGAIELKSVGTVCNDLNSNFHRDKMISTKNASTSTASTAIPYVEHSSAVNVTRRRQTNGTITQMGQSEEEDSIASHDNNVLNLEAVDDFDDCEQEKSGSPCTSGGLHMPDRSQLQKFARSIRTRYYSQTHSDSGGCSTGTSPQDINSYLVDSKVRRTNSCPEMKKSSPNSMVSFGHSDKLSLPEEDEEGEEAVDTNSRSFVENHVSKNVEMVCCGTQTEELQPFHFPYEHLFLDVFPPLHPNPSSGQCLSSENGNPVEGCQSVYEKMYAPSKVLQKYIDAAVYSHTEKTPLAERVGHWYDSKYLVSQLKLMSIQMQFEEYRREIHAERNRRLLGRSRRNKTLEEHNSALKDQILLLQRDLEDRSLDLEKIEALKEMEVQNERRSAEYWKDRYDELEKEHKEICDRCEEIEAQLKDERKMTAGCNKFIYEGKAALIDVTNELRANQREARAAKELRPKVAQLQAEILKAGEMIIRYHRRLTEYIRPPPDGTQHKLMQAAFKDEVNRLRNALRNQCVSLEATRALIDDLRKDLRNKENDSRKVADLLRAAQDERKKELQELKNSYEELKKSYNREVERAQELAYQLDNAKRVNRLSQVPPRLVLDYMNASRYALSSASSSSAAVTCEGSSAATTSSLTQSQITDPAGSRLLKSSSSNVEELRVDSRKNSFEYTSQAENSGESTDPTGVFVKRKGRMECAESGQLTVRSTQSSDVDTSTSNK